MSTDLINSMHNLKSVIKDTSALLQLLCMDQTELLNVLNQWNSAAIEEKIIAIHPHITNMYELPSLLLQSLLCENNKTVNKITTPQGYILEAQLINVSNNGSTMEARCHFKVYKNNESFVEFTSGSDASKPYTMKEHNKLYRILLTRALNLDDGDFTLTSIMSANANTHLFFNSNQDVDLFINKMCKMAVFFEDLCVIYPQMKFSSNKLLGEILRSNLGVFDYREILTGKPVNPVLLHLYEKLATHFPQYMYKDPQGYAQLFSCNEMCVIVERQSNNYVYADRNSAVHQRSEVYKKLKLQEDLK